MNTVVAEAGDALDNWTLDCAVDRKLDVLMADGLVAGECGALSRLVSGKRVFVLTTPTVNRHYGEAFRRLLKSSCAEYGETCLPLTERSKDLSSVMRVCHDIQQFGLDRHGILIALGGGVCSDVLSVSASLVRRGVQHIRVPTTLLGAVDAGIGLKGGVNFGAHKNYLGCFHSPTHALIDVAYLRTLPRARIRQGLAEILKMALIADRGLFTVLRNYGAALVESRFQSPSTVGRRVVARSIELMLRELQQNPYENRASERLADMGHTFSPALEPASDFGLSHGEAVSIDMAFTCVLARMLGVMPEQESNAFIALLVDLGLPIYSPLLTLPLCEEAMHQAMRHRGGKLNMVAPTRIGAGTFLGIESLPASLLSSAIDALKRKCM
jgi:2-epi-5-epi-valiolone synthase